MSHDFDLGDWQPDRKTTVRKNIFLWIVPAKVAGRWQMRLPLPPIERLLELELKQRYQEVVGQGAAERRADAGLGARARGRSR